MLKTLALAAALLPLAVNAVNASNLPDYPFIHASGEGYLTVAPDLGEIDFDITAYDPDPAVALATVQTRVEEIRALIAEQGGDTVADATVYDVRKDVRKAASAEASAPEYDIRSSVHINVRDLGKWRPIMLGLLSKPDIDHMSTTFGRTDRIKTEQELTAEAVKDAQRRAEAMATGFGKRVGAVTAITNGQLRNLTKAVGLMPSDFANARRGSDASTGDKDFLMVQSLRWSQTVDMIFRIK